MCGIDASHTFAAAVGEGARVAARGLEPNALPQFKVAATDADGKMTKLRVRSK